jgi:hypothetical protein
MPLTYQKNKAHIYKYRVKNYARVLEINRKSKQKHDMWKKIQKVFFNILLEV